jgi:hypothetical protein
MILRQSKNPSNGKMKNKVKSMFIILYTKNLFWQAKQSIPNTTVTFYGDCMKMCEGFAPNFGDKKLAVAS